MKCTLIFLTFVCLHMSLAKVLETQSPQVDLLQRLVTVSSGTNDIVGVRNVQKLMAEELQKLGFQIEFVSGDSDTKAQQLLATLKGQKPQFITFVGHADTVFEKLNHFEISKDGARIKGSGVGDDKGGMVVGLFALRDFLKSQPLPKYSLRFVISPSEETGSVGFRKLLKSYAEDSILILGLEPAIADGSVVKARKGVIWYEVNVHGTEAHAGLNPETGVNACQYLATLIEKISALNNFKTGNTLSVGHMEGGKEKFNIVCGEARAKIDFRFVDQKSRDQIHRKIESILAAKSKAKADLTKVTEVPPFSVSEKSAKWIAEYQKQVESIEHKKPGVILSGAAADLNYMSGSTAVMLDAPGPVGDGYHTIEETIETASLETRSKALTQFLIQFSASEH